MIVEAVPVCVLEVLWNWQAITNQISSDYAEAPGRATVIVRHRVRLRLSRQPFTGHARGKGSGAHSERL